MKKWSGVPLKRLRSGFGAENVWSRFVTIVLGVVGAYLVTNVVLEPTKRNIEVLAGVIFLGFVLIAHPFKALLFTTVILFFPASTSVGTTSTLLIFAVGGLVMMKSRLLDIPSPFVNKKADLALLGFMLTMVLSLYKQDMSYAKEVMILFTGFISAITLYYIIIQLVNTKEKFFRILSVFEVMAILMGILAILQSMFPQKHFLPVFFRFAKEVASLKEIRMGEVRASATFAGYEIFAEFAVISIFFQYFLFRRARTLNQKIFWLAGSIIMLMALFGTGTRAGIIVLVGGLFYAIATSGLGVPRKDLLKLAFVGFALFYLMLPFIGGYTEMMMERLSSLGTDDSSVQSRELVMRQALHAIPDSPYIGHGIYTPKGTFRGGVTINIHSLYVTLAYKFGIPNLLMFLWFISTLFKSSWRWSRDLTIPRELREFMFVLNVALVMFLLDEAKIEFVRTSQSMHVTFFMFALIPALEQIILKSRREGFKRMS